MTYEFDGLTFLSADARAWFINADASAQREWRQKHAPMQAPVHSEIIIDPAPRAESPPAQPGAGGQHANIATRCSRAPRITAGMGGRSCGSRTRMAQRTRAERPHSMMDGRIRRRRVRCQIFCRTTTSALCSAGTAAISCALIRSGRRRCR